MDVFNFPRRILGEDLFKGGVAPETLLQFLRQEHPQEDLSDVQKFLSIKQGCLGLADVVSARLLLSRDLSVPLGVALAIETTPFLRRIEHTNFLRQTEPKKEPKQPPVNTLLTVQTPSFQPKDAVSGFTVTLTTEKKFRDGVRVQLVSRHLDEAPFPFFFEGLSAVPDSDSATQALTLLVERAGIPNASQLFSLDQSEFEVDFRSSSPLLDTINPRLNSSTEFQLLVKKTNALPASTDTFHSFFQWFTEHPLIEMPFSNIFLDLLECRGSVVLGPQKRQRFIQHLFSLPNKTAMLTNNFCCWLLHWAMVKWPGDFAKSIGFLRRLSQEFARGMLEVRMEAFSVEVSFRLVSDDIQEFLSRFVESTALYHSAIAMLRLEQSLPEVSEKPQSNGKYRMKDLNEFVRRVVGQRELWRVSLDGKGRGSLGLEPISLSKGAQSLHHPLSELEGAIHDQLKTQGTIKLSDIARIREEVTGPTDPGVPESGVFRRSLVSNFIDEIYLQYMALRLTEFGLASPELVRQARISTSSFPLVRLDSLPPPAFSKQMTFHDTQETRFYSMASQGGQRGTRQSPSFGASPSVSDHRGESRASDALWGSSSQPDQLFGRPSDPPEPRISAGFGKRSNLSLFPQLQDFLGHLSQTFLSCNRLFRLTGRKTNITLFSVVLFALDSQPEQEPLVDKTAQLRKRMTTLTNRARLSVVQERKRSQLTGNHGPQKKSEIDLVKVAVANFVVQDNLPLIEAFLLSRSRKEEKEAEAPEDGEPEVRGRDRSIVRPVATRQSFTLSPNRIRQYNFYHLIQSAELINPAKKVEVVPAKEIKLVQTVEMTLNSVAQRVVSRTQLEDKRAENDPVRFPTVDHPDTESIGIAPKSLKGDSVGGNLSGQTASVFGKAASYLAHQNSLSKNPQVTFVLGSPEEDAWFQNATHPAKQSLQSQHRTSIDSKKHTLPAYEEVKVSIGNSPSKVPADDAGEVKRELKIETGSVGPNLTNYDAPRNQPGVFTGSLHLRKLVHAELSLDAPFSQYTEGGQLPIPGQSPTSFTGTVLGPSQFSRKFRSANEVGRRNYVKHLAIGKPTQ